MRFFCRLALLSFSSFSLFLGLIFFTSKNFIYAQDAAVKRDDIGPEVAGVGYTKGEQEGLNSALLVPQQYNGVVQIANGLDEAPYNPTPQSPKVVIRVVGFDFNAPASKFAAYGTALCTNQGLFPPGTIVMVGNELNNLDLEYQGVTGASDSQKLANAGKQYATQFNALASAVSACGQHFRVAPAPPDLYNGVWDPVPWINSFRSNGGCAGAEYLIANIFDVGGSRVGLPALDAWRYLETDMCPGKKVIHFGGIGVNPNTQPPPSIQTQLDFLNNYQLPAGVETAATLILDPCKNSNVTKSDWLFYVYGKAYDKDGVEVGDSCDNRQKKVFVYPGIEDMQSTAEKNAMAASYMLTCGSKVSLQGEIMGEDKLSDALPNYDSRVGDTPGQPNRFDGPCTWNNPACSFEVIGNVFIDNTKTVIPLFRLQNASVPRPTDPSRRMDDLEGFFSSSYTKQETDQAKNFIHPLANGVAKKLTSSETQCKNTLTYLQAIKKLCDEENIRSNIKINKIGTGTKTAPTATTPESDPPGTEGTPQEGNSDDPVGECALYLKIPGAKTYDNYRKVLENVPNSSQACTPTWTEKVQTSNTDWYKAFTSIEVTTPKGFKPAYLVRYMDRPEERASTFESKVNWLTPSRDETNPDEIVNLTINDRINITKIYVPAGFAEENTTSVPEKRSFFPTYDGGFTQVIKSILPSETINRIQELTNKEVTDITARVGNPTYNSPNPDKKYVQCTKCSQIPTDDYRGIIVRRINAQFFTQINFGATLGTPFAGCTFDDYVGETAKDIVQTVNPDGNPDPVEPRRQTAAARLTAGGTGSEPQTIRTFLLLPEEYRTINNYELDFLKTFIPYETRNNPEFEFIARKSERKSPKNPYRYLQLSNSGFDISSGTQQARDPIGTNLNAPIPPDPSDPSATTAPVSDGPDVYLKGRITGTKAVSEFNPDPQVPGGRLARGLWEIMCNVLRPNDNIPTTQYAGFEAFLKDGMSACTKGSKPSSPTSNSNLCQGTTAVPSGVTGLKALVQKVATEMNIPVNTLWGVFRMEGTSTFTAASNGKTSLACSANSVGAVGPMGILTKTCGGVFDNWEKYSVQAGVSSKTACDLEASLRVAAVILNIFYNNPTQNNCAPNYSGLSTDQKKWVDAAASYNGSCTPLVGVKFGCAHPTKVGTWLTYGECAILKYGPGF